MQPKVLWFPLKNENYLRHQPVDESDGSHHGDPGGSLDPQRAVGGHQAVCLLLAHLLSTVVVMVATAS